MPNKPKRVVIKIGSALLTHDGEYIDVEHINDWAMQVAKLRAEGIQVVLVSSGAVAAGMERLGWSTRPKEIYKLQAAAAVGQTALVNTWDDALQAGQLQAAQILLTNADMSDRRRYLNARSTLLALLKAGVVPVINENDTVVTDEIRFGDNDTLAALVANLIEADRLIILTDQLGLFTKNPRQYSDAKLVSNAQASDASLDEMVAGPGGVLGQGGMATKLRAARLAARSGASTHIASGREDQVLTRVVLAGEALGTCLQPNEDVLSAREQWMVGQLRVSGRLHLDSGAVRALLEMGKSLLPVGVVRCSGHFLRGDLVACIDPDGNEIARGLVNYSHMDAAHIIGQPSSKISETLGYLESKELIHRDNLTLI